MSAGAGRDPHEELVRALELERLRPVPPVPGPPDAWRPLLDLIAGECRRAGLLP